MEKLKPSYKIKFGKNKGKTLAEIYQYQPSYIEWAIINVDDFFIDIEAFYKLPNPTPYNYKPEHFETIENNMSSNKQNTFELDEITNFFEKTDQLNVTYNIDELIEFSEKEEMQEIPNFRFPNKIVKLNEEKYNLSKL